MALSIVSNQAASIATRSLEQSNNAATSSAEKLSSGKRVNSAKDDAAASAIAARLSAEVAGLQTASVNAGQASSLLQIADGAFQNTEDILTRAKSLAVQAGSDNISDTERAFLDQEFQALKNEIDRISADTEFNGNKLVDGAVATGLTGGGLAEATVRNVEAGTTLGTITGIMVSLTAMGSAMVTLSGSTATTTATDTAAFMTNGGSGTVTQAQVATIKIDTSNGAMATFILRANEGGTLTAGTGSSGSPMLTDNGLAGGTGAALSFKVGTGVNSAEDEISISTGSVSTTSLGIGNTDITTTENANSASVAVTAAIDALQNARSEVGAAQNRLDFASQNVELTRENQEAARSELEDLNVAKAITEFSQQQLLVQAGTSTLSQANQLPQNLLQLFR